METRTLYGERGEWVGTISFREWEHGEGEYHNYACELLFHTDYGNYAYSWSHMGLPMKQFLAKLSQHYTLGKLAQGDLDEHDPEGTRKCAFEYLFERRRERSIDAETAREAYDDLIQCEDDGRSMYDCMADHSHAFGRDSYEFMCTRAKQSHIDFWDRVWVPFVKHLGEE